jgi:hypothetical protein
MEVGYSVRLGLPQLIERGRDNVVSVSVYRDGVLVAPSAVAAALVNAAGATVATVTGSIVSSVAQATIAAASVAAEQLGDGWRITWTLTLAGVVRTFNHEAALVRSAFSAPIADADLYRRVSALNPNGGQPLSTLTTFQAYIDEAHEVIGARLINQGRRPWLIMSPGSLREIYLVLTLALIFEDFTTRQSEVFREDAARYRAQYEAAWAGLRFAYDEDQDGRAEGGRRRPAASVWFLGRGPR